MAKRRVNGEGSVYQRKDGRWVGAAMALMASGTRKRVAVYGKTRLEASQKLTEILAKTAAGLLVPDGSVKLADYLGYWLDNFIKLNKEPSTWDQYEVVVRLYLKPGLGSFPVKQLTVPMLQAYFNKLLVDGLSKSRVKSIRTVLSGALTRAHREGLVGQNVARSVELPKQQRKAISTWTVDEANAFLMATRNHRLHAAFALLVFYGMRRGEVLGLRWCDVDFADCQLHIRQQLRDLRHGRGPTIGQLKTDASERDLPLSSTVAAVLLAHYQQQTQARASLGLNWGGSGDDNELVFTSKVGTRLFPGNFNTTFHALCARHDVREIKLHHIRHTAATIMKDQGVPARDVQFILGHATPWVTEQIYQHDSMASRTAGLAKIEAAIVRPGGLPAQIVPQEKHALLSRLLSDRNFVDKKTSLQSGKGEDLKNFNGIAKRGALAEIISFLQEEMQKYRSDQPVFLCAVAARRQYWLGRVAIKLATQSPLSGRQRQDREQ
jgi:integrase